VESLGLLGPRGVKKRENNTNLLCRETKAEGTEAKLSRLEEVSGDQLEAEG
jgi:hypothetical protein